VERHGTVEEGLGQAHRAERKGEGELDETADRADHFETPATDVEHEGATVVELKVVGHRTPGEPGLGVGVDDGEGDSHLLPHPGHELRPIARFPHGGRGDGPEIGDTPPRGDLAHPCQSG
jgi:hypothetical protein